jgi:hypothetical protein
MGLVEMETKLVYYDTRRGTWGTPLIVTGIQETEPVSRVRIYPNPAREYVIVESDSPIGRIRVHDSSGRTLFVQEVRSHSQRISVDGLDPGMYHIGVEVEDAVHWQRIVIHKL